MHSKSLVYQAMSTRSMVNKCSSEVWSYILYLNQCRILLLKTEIRKQKVTWNLPQMCMTGNWYGKLTVTPLYVCVTICVRETDLIHMILWHHSGVIWTGLASKDRVCSRLFNLKEPLKFTGCTCWIQACDSGMQLKKPLCTPTDIFLFIYSLISGSLPLSVKSKAFLYDQEKKCCQS